MFSFFRKSQDSKKVTVPEREADGFVIVVRGQGIQKKQPSPVTAPESHKEEFLTLLRGLNDVLTSCTRKMIAGMLQKSSEGDTIDDQRRESKDKTSFPETRPMYNQPPQGSAGHRSQLPGAGAEVGSERGQSLEGSPFVSDLLSDVPFALAPHVLAVQGTQRDVPDRLLTCDANDNLSRFWYDFTLENSVLCDP